MKLSAQAHLRKNCICHHTEQYHKNKIRKKTQHRGESRGFSSQASPCHQWHKQLFSYFPCTSFKFPFCILEMNIWSFSPWTCHQWAFEAVRHCIVFLTLRDIQEKKIKLIRRGRTWKAKHCVLAVYLFRGPLCFKCSDHKCLGATALCYVCFSGNDCLL